MQNAESNIATTFGEIVSAAAKAGAHHPPTFLLRCTSSPAPGAATQRRPTSTLPPCLPTHPSAYPPADTDDDDDNDNDNDDDGEYDEEFEPDLDKEEGMGGSRGGPPAGFGHGIVVSEI